MAATCSARLRLDFCWKYVTNKSRQFYLQVCVHPGGNQLLDLPRPGGGRHTRLCSKGLIELELPAWICSRVATPLLEPCKCQAQMSPGCGIPSCHSLVHTCGVLFHQGWPRTNVQSNSYMGHILNLKWSQLLLQLFQENSSPLTPTAPFCPPPVKVLNPPFSLK